MKCWDIISSQPFLDASAEIVMGISNNSMAEYCQSSAGILTYFKEIWQDYAVKIPYLCAVRNF